MGMAGPGIEPASGGATAQEQPSLRYQSPAHCDLNPRLLVSDTSLLAVHAIETQWHGLKVGSVHTLPQKASRRPQAQWRQSVPFESIFKKRSFYYRR